MGVSTQLFQMGVSTVEVKAQLFVMGVSTLEGKAQLPVMALSTLKLRTKVTLTLFLSFLLTFSETCVFNFFIQSTFFQLF